MQYFKTLKQVSSKTYILAEWADINSHTMPTFSIILLNNLLILREHQRPFNALYYPWKVFGVLSLLLYKKREAEEVFFVLSLLQIFFMVMDLRLNSFELWKCFWTWNMRMTWEKTGELFLPRLIFLKSTTLNKSENSL